MVLGTLAAVIHGTALPLMMLVFGDMTDSFSNAGSSISSNITNQSKFVCCADFIGNVQEKTLTDMVGTQIGENCGSFPLITIVPAYLLGICPEIAGNA